MCAEFPLYVGKHENFVGTAARTLQRSPEVRLTGKAPMDLENRLQTAQQQQEWKSLSAIGLQASAPFCELKKILCFYQVSLIMLTIYTSLSGRLLTLE